MKNNHKKVLNWVNSQRKHLGLKPLSALPKGDPESLASCPIANAFITKDISDVEVDDEVRLTTKLSVPKTVHDFISKLNSDDYDFSDLLRKTIETVHTIELPTYVSEFIENFDNGMYPELVKE